MHGFDIKSEFPKVLQFQQIDMMEALIAEAPSLVGCKALTIKGPVKLQPGIVFHGNVTVTNDSTEVKELATGFYDQDVTV